jgi:hypothetical protein
MTIIERLDAAAAKVESAVATVESYANLKADYDRLVAAVEKVLGPIEKLFGDAPAEGDVSGQQGNDTLPAPDGSPATGVSDPTAPADAAATSVPPAA